MMHEGYLHRCLELAQRAKGHTTPNPMVGAVLVHEDRIIGEGYHHFYGGVHAEVDCLDSVSEADKHLIPASTMYVSLEPCAHFGKRPPCAHRIVAEGIEKVVVTNRDPFAQVSGRGFEILKEAGVAVVGGLLEAEGRWVNRRFFCFHEQQRPYIVLKWAQSADGFIAPSDRSRMALSGSLAKRLVHRWRTEESAILVGYRTALNDDPELTARLWKGPQPLRVVIDRDLSLPQSHKIFRPDAETWVVNAHQEEVVNTVRYLKLDFSQGVPLQAILQQLHNAGKLSLFVEGGPATTHDFIRQGLWDEARVLTAPLVLGDGITAPVLKNAMPAFATSVAEDGLNIYTRNGSSYPYVAGMEL